MDKLPKAVSKYLGSQPGLKILIITVLIAVGVFAVAAMFGKVKEGFGSFYSPQNDFTNKQQDYFSTKFNRGIVHNAGLENEISRIDDAFKQVDTQFNTIRNPNLQRFFSVDPLPGVLVLEQKCSSATEPSQLPAHDPAITSGCGWWYMDDDNKISKGFRGSEMGPYDTNLESKMPGGRWIWDLKEAQKLEDVKKCRRVKSCDTCDLVPGKCAFCLQTNSGIPVDGYGGSKYPDDPRLNCGDKPITKPNQCPKPEPPPPIIKEDGTVIQPPAPRAICDPEGGRLTKECLISLAKGAGLSDSGAVIIILQGDGAGYYKGRGENSIKFNKAKDIVFKDCKIVTDPAYLGDGVCDRTDALKYYNSLFEAVNRGPTTRCREAAGFLVAGTEFDVCKYDPDQRGPFELYCLQRTFRESGCQPDGSEYPTDANKGKFDAMSWKGYKEYSDLLRMNSNSSDFQVQMENAKMCLGVNITPKLNECGEKRGVEILWYKWDYDWNMPEVKTTKMTFLGREFARELPNFNTGGNEFNPYGRSDVIAFRARTELYTEQDSRSAKLWVMTDDGVAIKANGQIILRKWWDQGPTAHESDPFILRQQKNVPVEFYWYENYGGATFIPKMLTKTGGYDPIPQEMLMLKVSTGFPLSRWDFYMGNYEDRHGVLNTTANNLQMGIFNGKKCALFMNQNSSIQINNVIRGGAYRTFTYMVYVRNIPNYWSRLYTMRRGPSNCDAGFTHGNSSTIEGGICDDGKIWMGLKPAGQGWHIWIHTPPVVPKNKWCHITFAYDDDYKGAAVYLDGKLIQRTRNEGSAGDFFDNLECNFSGIGIGHYDWKCNGQPIYCGLAWTHWFDYTLDDKAVMLDMQMGFTKSTAYPEDATTGWKAAN